MKKSKRTSSRQRVAAAIITVTGLVLTGCATASVSADVTNHRSVSTTSLPPTTTTTTEQPGWTPVSTVGTGIAIDSQSVTEPTGHVVTIFRFRAGHTHFGLHAGSTDPPLGNATVVANDGPSIGPDEVPVLLAAFNGGFKASAGAGGIELSGQVLVPLQVGRASLVIDTDGVAHVGVWGENVPTSGEQVASVRQNLTPLIAGGAAAANVNEIAAWGATLGGGATVARSALAEDGSGSLLYAASMDALPADLANALIGAGAVTGMELDINPEWVQLAAAATPGGILAPGIPGQYRPGNQYQVGWTRDFVTVLAVP